MNILDRLRAKACRAFDARWIPLSLLILASLVSASSAQTPAKSLKEQLIGHWQLVSVTIHDESPYGTDVQGTMFLDAGGHYSVVVITAGQARSIAYFGNYVVNENENSVTFHVEASSRPNQGERDQTRAASFNGDELTLASQRPGPIGGVTLKWKRAN